MLYFLLLRIFCKTHLLWMQHELRPTQESKHWKVDISLFTSTLLWFLFRTKFRIKIILSFGHCFAKIDKRGGLNKGQGVDKISEN